MTSQSWASEWLSIVAPNSARIDDYLLGGGYNFASDRKLAAQLEGAIPGARDVALLTRVFLRRAVLAMLHAGVRQFIDLGSGISTVGNVHEIAQRADETARVVYVDTDPIAVAHTGMLLAGNARAGVVRADLREPDTVWRVVESCRLLDLDAPIGLLAVSVLHWVPDLWGPAGIVASYRDRLARGSYLALSHYTADTHPERMAATVEVFTRGTGQLHPHPRSREDILTLFTGFELLDPGLVTTAGWAPPSATPPPGAEHSEVLAGVGRKP